MRAATIVEEVVADPHRRGDPALRIPPMSASPMVMGTWSPMVALCSSEAGGLHFHTEPVTF